MAPNTLVNGSTTGEKVSLLRLLSDSSSGLKVCPCVWTYVNGKLVPRLFGGYFTDLRMLWIRFCCCTINHLHNTTGKGTLYQMDGSVFTGTFLGDEKLDGVVHLGDGIMRRERYINGILQGP
jgi:hypothetical protein